MQLKQGLKIALKNLRVNRSRSILTILGIVIGITAIILIVSTGKGAQNLILGQIQGFGSKMAVIIPGREPKGANPMSMLELLYSDSLKEKDLEALEKKGAVPNLMRIMPVVFGGVSASYGSEIYRLTVFGASDLAAEIYNIYPATGAFFTEEDIRANADAAVIGAKVKEELFGDSEALGQKIKIKGRNFRVVGILPQKGSGSMVNFDEAAFVPYTTAQYYLFGIKYYHRIAVEADEEKNVDQMISDIKTVLRSSHNITDPEKDDFYIQSQADMIKTVGTVTNILTMFLVCVAGVSLLVGGVGIMNIMLVSVTERTREIGLRKALGATKKDILVQFLLEAIALTLSGGLIGILMGSAFSFVVSLALSRLAGLTWTFNFPVFAAFLGLIVSALIGLGFGLYPAKKAAMKSPIEALRYE